MDLNLRTKRAIICGSTQGIGKAIALELANLGASVTLVARDEHKLAEVVKELFHTSGQDHNYLVADFNYPEALKSTIDGYLAVKNEAHILINNTGGPQGGLAIEASVAEYTRAFSQHLICNQILVQAVVPYMKQATYGRIINIISTSVKAPIPGLGVSNTIRAAVANWAKTLSVELGQFGITVNNVLPGMTMTGRLMSLIDSKVKDLNKSKEEIELAMRSEIPLGRFAEPSEIAAVAAFLCTPAASYINGINVPVDGGRTPAL